LIEPTARHSTLLEKLAKLNLPDEAYNWLKDFFDDHSHCTQFAGEILPHIGIIASVIQGSAIDPAAYVVNASDLRPINAENILYKFADDTNNHELNQSKSLDIAHPPSTIQDIERVNKLTVHGVIINDRLSADNHVTATIAFCSKSL